MDIKEKLTAIKILLGFEGEQAPTEVTPIEAASNTAKLKDGTEIQWTGELESGVEVTMTTAEGTKPVGDGACELEDGTILEVQDGKVTSITKAIAPEQGLTPEMAMSKEDFKAAIKPITKLIADLESLITTTEQAHKSEMAAMKAAFKGTVELVELMNNTPEKVDAPVNTSFSKQVDKESQFQKLADAIKANIKK